MDVSYVNTSSAKVSAIKVEFGEAEEDGSGAFRAAKEPCGFRCSVSLSFGNDAEFFIAQDNGVALAHYFEMSVNGVKVCFASPLHFEEGPGILYSWPAGELMQPPIKHQDRISAWLRERKGLLKIVVDSYNTGLVPFSLGESAARAISDFLLEAPNRPAGAGSSVPTHGRTFG